MCFDHRSAARGEPHNPAKCDPSDAAERDCDPIADSDCDPDSDANAEPHPIGNDARGGKRHASNVSRLTADVRFRRPGLCPDGHVEPMFTTGRARRVRHGLRSD